jgi:AI-2 transport protein TqsA
VRAMRDGHEDSHRAGVTAPGAATETRSSLPRGLIVVLVTTGLLVSVLALQRISEIVAPVLLALILVVGVYPLTGFLRRHGAPLWLAVTVTMITLIVLVLSLAAALALSIARLATILPTYQDSFTALVNNLKGWLDSLGIGQDQIQAAINKINFSNVAGLVTDLLAGVAGVFSNTLFLLFVVAFMALDAVGFAARLVRVRRQRADVVGALDSFVRGTRRYLLVATVFGLIVAAIDTTFLWLIGVPLPLLWGLLAFITNYIPNVGFIIGLIPPALLALLQGGPKLMITVIVAYSVINFIIQSIIQPKVTADAVSLSLTLTFLSLVFWSFVIGPIGAVLAVPLTLLVKALLLDVDPNTRWISSLFSGGLAPPDDDADNRSDRASEEFPDPDASAVNGQAPLSSDAQARLD